MQKKSVIFRVNLDNIPIINLRTEFVRYYHLFNDDDFLAQFKGHVQPIDTPYLTWYGMPETLITLIIQRIFVGVESYLPGAVYMELGFRHQLKDNIRFVKNPYLLGGKGTVDNFYHKLPSLVDKQFSLKKSNNILWGKTKCFYKDIRNPIFHGYEICGVRNSMQGVKNILNYILEIYKWIDCWHDFNKAFSTHTTKKQR